MCIKYTIEIFLVPSFMQYTRENDYLLINDKHKIYMPYLLQNILIDEFNNKSDSSLRQIAHTLDICPDAIVIGLPDMHCGYYLPIGSVVAFKIDQTNSHKILPSGIGGDINCGVRCLITNLMYKDIKDDIKIIADKLYNAVGIDKSKVTVDLKTFKNILRNGVAALNDKIIHEGESLKFDQTKINQSTNNLSEILLEDITQKEIGRGLSALGSIGKGNHYLEIQRVDESFSDILVRDQIVIFIHCGSRGLGNEIMKSYQRREVVSCKDEDYNKITNKMNAATNYALVNREVLSAIVSKTLKNIYGGVEISTLCDSGHNLIMEEEIGDNKYVVHRKGASRVKPGEYLAVGGSMATASYILMGDQSEETFYSACHGSGRILSRSEARANLNLNEVLGKMKGIELRAASKNGIVEEAADVYKDVDEVVDHCVKIGIVKKISRNKPIAVIKG